MSDRTECTKEATGWMFGRGTVVDTQRLQECAYDYPGPYKVEAPPAKEQPNVWQEIYFDVAKLFGMTEP